MSVVEKEEHNSDRGSGEGVGEKEERLPGVPRDQHDPHGNQTLRQPEGGSGAGESRGDESSYNPGNSGGKAEPSEADPVEPAE